MTVKTLVAGWFSFEEMGATAGDILARDLTCDWLRRADQEFDIAVAPPFRGGVDWRTVDPQEYSTVVFVCGPFGNGPPITEFLARFAGKRLLGLNLSMLDPLDTWNPFDLLLERDSSAAARPDMSFLAASRRVPVVGVVLVHPQAEYGARGRHREAHQAIEGLLAHRELSAVRIDTRLDVNTTGLRTAHEVETLIARMDLVVTTRLHGMVLSLKNGVPPLVVDPIAGGAKISRQAAAIGWPLVFTADRLTERALEEAFDYCLTEDARAAARGCRDGAVEKVRKAGEEFVAALKEAALPAAGMKVLRLNA